MGHNRCVLPDRAAQWVADVIGRGSRITSARRLHPGGVLAPLPSSRESGLPADSGGSVAPAVPVPGSPGKLWRGCERWPCRSDFQGGTLSGACAAGGSGGHRLRQAGGLAACPAGSSFLRSHGHSRRRGRHRARNSARSGGAHDPPGLASAPATKQNGTSTSPEVSIGRSVTAGSATPYTAPVDVNPSNCRRLMHSCTAGLCVARFGRSPPATCR